MQFDWKNPYPTIRSPLMARNVVSTSHPMASQAGLCMLLKGGNAIDAAIAAAAALTIVEPISNGLGSDNFAILWDGKDLHGLNSSGVAVVAFWQIAVCRPDGAGDRAGRARPWCGCHRRRQVGAPDSGAAGSAGVCCGLHAARPCAGAGRAIRIP